MAEIQVAKNEKCALCSYELKWGEQRIIQTSEKGIAGMYHRECYGKKKVEKLSREM